MLTNVKIRSTFLLLSAAISILAVKIEVSSKVFNNLKPFCIKAQTTRFSFPNELFIYLYPHFLHQNLAIVLLSKNPY